MYKGEYFNSISHLVAAVLALVGAAVLITVVAIEGDALKLASVTVYSVGMCLLYVMSTLYHSFSGRAKAIFQKLDHASIYIMIAGTYTPFALIAVGNQTGWWLFGVIWSLAVLGIIIENMPIKGPRVIPIVIYLAMGWACVFTMDSLIAGLSPIGFNLLLAGGLVYTIGVVFYVLDHWFPIMHGVWHLFVIGGSACHYFAIFML